MVTKTASEGVAHQMDRGDSVGEDLQVGMEEAGEDMDPQAVGTNGKVEDTTTGIRSGHDTEKPKSVFVTSMRMQHVSCLRAALTVKSFSYSFAELVDAGALARRSHRSALRPRSDGRTVVFYLYGFRNSWLAVRWGDVL
jgi:hypothetical protein